MLDDRLSLLLQKGLNYAVTPRSVPIEDILGGVEKGSAIPTCEGDRRSQARDRENYKKLLQIQRQLELRGKH